MRCGSGRSLPSGWERSHSRLRRDCRSPATRLTTLWTPIRRKDCDRAGRTGGLSAWPTDGRPREDHGSAPRPASRSRRAALPPSPPARLSRPALPRGPAPPPAGRFGADGSGRVRSGQGRVRSGRRARRPPGTGTWSARGRAVRRHRERPASRPKAESGDCDRESRAGREAGCPPARGGAEPGAEAPGYPGSRPRRYGSGSRAAGPPARAARTRPGSWRAPGSVAGAGLSGRCRAQWPVPACGDSAASPAARSSLRSSMSSKPAWTLSRGPRPAHVPRRRCATGSVGTTRLS